MKKTVSCVLTTVTMFSVSLSHAQKKDTVSTRNIDEVVVVGYATKSKKELTNAISKVPDKVLQSAPRSNVATALQGTVAGVKITQTTGQPGTTPNIQVRGGTDWGGGGSPLILVDGVPSSFYGLNSEDIQSITVMKDAAATAVYGARGANGVVVVTTKKGRSGRSSINFGARTTFNFQPQEKMKYMGAADFVAFNRRAIQNYKNQIDPNGFTAYLTGQYPAATGNNTTNSIYTTMILNDSNRYLLSQPGWMSIDDPLTPGQKLIFMDNNLDKLFFQKAMTQDYTVSFDGGNDKGTFYSSLGYMDDKGLIYGSEFKRVSGTLNGSYNIKDNFKITANLNYIRVNATPTYLNNDQFIFQRAKGLAPTTRIYYNNPDGSLGAVSPGVGLNFGNPLYYNDKFYRNNLEKRVNTSVQADWAFLPDFNLMIRGSYFNTDVSNEYFAKAYYDGSTLISSRNSSFSTSSVMRNQLTSILSYKKTFGSKHNVDALVGSEYFKENSLSTSAAAKNSPTDLIYTMNVAAEADGPPSSYKSLYAIGSLFSQVHYDYDNRYLLDVNFRADGTSRLAKENRFDYFPGIALGWNLHREAFYSQWNMLKYINIFKPRISYGVNGNIDVLSNFGVYGQYVSGGIYNGQSTYVNSILPNYPLRWERSKTLNFGLDTGFFNNRLSFTGDYFIKDIQNKLSPLVLPIWTGFSSITQNNGTLRVKGLEMEMAAKIINAQNLKWSIGANYSQYKSYAKQLPPSKLANNRQGGEQIYDPVTGQVIYVGGLEEGQRVGNDLVTVYVFDGVYKTQAELDADKSLNVSFARKPLQRFLGDTKWKDLNGDKIIDYRDRIVLGRTTPKYSGGINTDLSYKNFNLYGRADFAVGHLVLNSRKLLGLSQVQGAINGSTDVTQTWTPENPNADLPQFVFTDPQKNYTAGSDGFGNNTSASSLLWEKGDYLAIREITLSYNLPGSLLNNTLKNMRIYLTGSNLAYITKFSGSFPEAGGVDFGKYPIPRSFTLGFNTTF